MRRLILFLILVVPVYGQSPDCQPTPFNSQTCSWASLDGADTATAADMASNPDKSVEISGTYDSATIVIQGSNSGATWFTLTDYDGNSLSYTTGNKLVGIRENVRLIRPVTSGGGGSTALNIIIHGSGGHQ